MSDAGDGGHWLTVEQAAAALSRSSRTVRRMAGDGRLPSRKQGARLYVNVADFVSETPELSDVASLQGLVKELRKDVDRLTVDNDRLTVDNDRLWKQVQFQNSQIATLTRLTEHEAIEQPRQRRFRWPWQSGDN